MLNHFLGIYVHGILTALLLAVLGGVRYRFTIYRNGTKIPHVRFKFYIEGYKHGK